MSKNTAKKHSRSNAMASRDTLPDLPRWRKESTHYAGRKRSLGSPLQSLENQQPPATSTKVHKPTTSISKFRCRKKLYFKFKVMRSTNHKTMPSSLKLYGVLKLLSDSRVLFNILHRLLELFLNLGQSSPYEGWTVAGSTHTRLRGRILGALR